MMLQIRALIMMNSFSVEDKETFRGKFYGLGADGTVGANKIQSKLLVNVRTILLRVILFMIQRNQAQLRYHILDSVPNL